MIFAEGTYQGLTKPEMELIAYETPRLNGRGVEIGSCDGYSTRVIMTYHHNLTLTSIDPMMPDSMNPSVIGSFSRLQENAQWFGSQWAFLNATSRQVFHIWKNEINFLFIDGDHNYDEVLFDFVAWGSLLSRGGILAMHDCRSRHGGPPEWPGPSQVADEKIYSKPDKWKIIGEADSLLIAEKLK